jgi:transcriptional regulator with XRE-family HTH domain
MLRSVNVKPCCCRIENVRWSANMADETLGDTIRMRRVALSLGLRALAADLGVSPSYVSDIENDRRVPSEEVLKAIGTRLALDYDKLMALAGRFGEEADRYMRRTPAAGALFRRLSERGYSDEQVRKILHQIEEEPE